MVESVRQGARTLSAALFGNEKMAEVVQSLAKLRPATAQMIADDTRIQYTLVRDVLKRLEKADVLVSVRSGGGRSALFYEPKSDALWDAVQLLAAHVCQTAGSQNRAS